MVLRPRIRATLFVASSITAILLVVATALSAFYHLYWLHRGQRAALAIETGGFYFQFSRQPTGFGYARPPYGWTIRPNSLYSPGSGRPWMLFPDFYLGPSPVCLIKVPLWLPTLVLMTLAMYTRPRPSKLGACRTCGYDRRGLAKGAACPECGNS